METDRQDPRTGCLSCRGRKDEIPHGISATLHPQEAPRISHQLRVGNGRSIPVALRLISLRLISMALRNSTFSDAA